MNENILHRRSFLKLFASAGAAALLPQATLALAHKPASPPLPSRHLILRHIHTGEQARFDYIINGQVQANALQRMYHLLRDHRSGQAHVIDPALLEQLYRLQQVSGTRQPIDVISGYRSPKTNAMLASRSNGVAKKSYHMKGMAIDISIPDVQLGQLHKAALQMQAGGVGRYSRSGFVHLDTGPVRKWGA